MNGWIHFRMRSHSRRRAMKPKEHEYMYQFIKDFWTFMKTYWAVEDTDAAWDELLADADTLARKYQDDTDIFQTVKTQIVAFIKELDARRKRGKA